jgi:hypothetical protein
MEFSFSQRLTDAVVVGNSVLPPGLGAVGVAGRLRDVADLVLCLGMQVQQLS